MGIARLRWSAEIIVRTVCSRTSTTSAVYSWCAAMSNATFSFHRAERTKRRRQAVSNTSAGTQWSCACPHTALHKPDRDADDGIARIVAIGNIWCLMGHCHKATVLCVRARLKWLQISYQFFPAQFCSRCGKWSARTHAHTLTSSSSYGVILPPHLISKSHRAALYCQSPI